MKKMLLATALALLVTGCVSRRSFFFFFFFFLELGRRKLSMQPKFVAAQKMLLKQKPSKHS